MGVELKADSVCKWDTKKGFILDGKPVYIVGTNYVASYICTNFWKDWRPEKIAKDLDNIAALGLNAVRIPINWEYAEPKAGEFWQEALDRFDSFFEMCNQRGLLVMPWLLVGVATQNYDVSWRNGSSFFAEPMVSHAENHVKTIVNRLKKFPNILCWDLCDEPEGYSFMDNPGDTLPYDVEQFHQWADRIYDAAKEADPVHSVTLGYGNIGICDQGMDVYRAAKKLDMMGITMYPPQMEEDLLTGFRSGYFIGWYLRWNDCANKGVFSLEAPGWNDIHSSEEVIGDYFRITLMSNIANSSMGVMPWVWNDFDDEIQNTPPLDERTFEKSFGICRLDGSYKPAAEELRKFGDFVCEYPPNQWKQIPPEVNVLVPTIHKKDSWQEVDLLFHHYIFLRQAGLRVRYIWADDLDDFEGNTIFLPQSKLTPFTTGTWTKLLGLAKKGVTVVSTSQGIAASFNELFGVILEGTLTKYKDVVFTDCDKTVEKCKSITLPKGANFRLVRTNGAKILCQTDEGEPLVTANSIGKGKAIHIAYSPEEVLQQLPPEELAKHNIHKLFRAIADIASLRYPVTCDDPRIEIDVRKHDQRLLVILINHSRYPVESSFLNNRTGKKYKIELEGSGVFHTVLEAKG